VVSNNNTAATQFNWIYLADPTTKKDVVGSIGASIDIASRWTQSTFSTISNRLGWLKSHKGQSKTSYQGIRFDFNDATINTLMAAPSASFTQTNWTNAAVDHANRSTDSLSTLGQNVVMDVTKAVLNEAAIVRQNATGTLSPVFKPIYNGWSIWTDGTVEDLKMLEIGVNSTPLDTSCDLVLYTVFDSFEALTLFQNHPKHLKIKQAAKEWVLHRHQVDYTC